MEKQLALETHNLTKKYKLYTSESDRLKEAIFPSGKKRHKEFYALNDVSFSVKKGETVGIIGQNGSGKSTLLKLITGVLTPSSGSISLNGTVSALLELGAGFNPDLTGVENIYFNGAIMGLSKEEIESKLEHIFAFADIGDYVYQPVKKYSSGMFARLAFALAINVDPEILIVDEALSVGDVYFQTKCYKKFNQFRDEGKTILFVTHSMETVLRYCSSAMVLNQGVKIAEGSPKQMVDVYKKLLVNCYDFDEKKQPVLKSKPTVNEDIQSELWKASYKISESKLEYGNHHAEIIDFGIFNQMDINSTTLMNDEICTIKMKVKFHQKIKDPIFAFAIKDIKGNELVGTNTMLEGIETGINNQNDIVTVSFSQKIKLRGGNYTLSLGCVGFEGEQLVVYHRLYDIVIVQISSIKDIAGVFDIDSKVEVAREI